MLATPGRRFSISVAGQQQQRLKRRHLLSHHAFTFLVRHAMKSECFFYRRGEFSGLSLPAFSHECGRPDELPQSLLPEFSLPSPPSSHAHRHCLPTFTPHTGHTASLRARGMRDTAAFFSLTEERENHHWPFRSLR